MCKKIGLYIQSLSLLFLSVIVLTIDFTDGLWTTNNILPLLCGILLVIAGFSYVYFNYFAIKGTQQLSVKIIHIEDARHESLTFLATYIIPLTFIGFNSIRYIIVLVIMIIAMGVIFSREYLMYANPTLVLLGYKTYKGDLIFRDSEEPCSIYLISKDKLNVGDSIRYIELEDNIYYAFKQSRNHE